MKKYEENVKTLYKNRNYRCDTGIRLICLLEILLVYFQRLGNSNALQIELHESSLRHLNNKRKGGLFVKRGLSSDVIIPQHATICVYLNATFVFKQRNRISI